MIRMVKGQNPAKTMSRLRSLSLMLVLGLFFAANGYGQDKAAPPDSNANANAAPAPGAGGDAAKGKEIFMANCARCHSPSLEKDMTGPALMGVTSRVPSRDWLYSWIPNSQKVIQSGDPYAKALFAKWKSTMDNMPVNKIDIDNILAFIDGYAPAGGTVDTTGGGGIDASKDPQVKSKWNWMLFLILLVVLMLARIASQVAKLRGVDSMAGMNLDKLNGALFLGFYIFGIIGSIYCAGLFKDFYLLTNSASEHGRDIDFMFWITMGVVVAVFVITNAILFYFSYKYSYSKDRQARYYPENHKLELLWTVVPAIVLTALVIYGVRTWTKVTNRPDKSQMATIWGANPKAENAYVNIELSGQQFAWIIRYPGMDEEFGDIDLHLIDADNILGVRIDQKKAADDFISDSLVLPKGAMVDLKIRSRDVLHSVYLPHFRVKMDAVPGMDTRFHFTPIQTTGEFREFLKTKEYYNEIDPLTAESPTPKKRYETFDYELACTEVCGKGHFSMQKKVVVMELPQFIEWYKKRAKIGNIKNAIEGAKMAGTGSPTGGNEHSAPSHDQ